MFRLLLRFIALFAIALLLFVAWQWMSGIYKAAPEEEGDIVTQQEVKPATPFDAVLVQQDSENGDKQILHCQEKCQPVKVPAEARGQALSNGTNWFYYTRSTDASGQERVQLVTTPLDRNEPKIIASQSQLIQPRDLLLSPTGNKLAYFLDNIDKPAEKLTEVWVYDVNSGAVTVVAENLYIPDMMTRLRWNSSGTHLWFIAQSGNEKKSKVEFITLNADSKNPRSVFTALNWDTLREVADRGVMDINSTGERVSYSKPGSGISVSKLVVVDKDSQQFSVALAGTIAYIEWLPDGALLYAIQDNLGFSFWKTVNNRANVIATSRGVLRSAHRDASGDYVVIAADTDAKTTKLLVLDIGKKVIAPQESIPLFGDRVYVVQVQPSASDKNPAVAGVTSQLTDEEIAGFVDAHIKEITLEDNPQKIRLIVTQEPNVALLDYVGEDKKLRRISLIIRDAIHPEWAVRDRYEDIHGTWQKVQGGGLSDPKPLRLYEWEGSLNRWILKQELSR